MIYHIRIRKEMTKKKLAQIHKRKKSQKFRVEKNKNTTMDMFLLGAPWAAQEIISPGFLPGSFCAKRLQEGVELFQVLLM